MKISIDISQAVYEGTGVGRFTSNLAATICSSSQSRNDHHWQFFATLFRRQLPADLRTQIASAGIPLIQFPAPPTVAEFVWNRLRLFPISDLLPHSDWVITSDWTEPPSTIKKATIVHDLVFARYPETVDQKILQTMQRKIPLVSRESSLIFTDSDATRKDLLANYPETSAPVITNYPGVSTEPIPDAEARSIRERFNLQKPYLITVGKQEPRKNLRRLIDAFGSLRRDDITLVIVGAYGWGEKVSALPETVQTLGFVSDRELTGLYQQSSGCVVPSIWEGFGYPVLEAMQLEVPVACSQTSSLGEIAGTHAQLFDPFSTDEIAAALINLIDRPPTETAIQEAKLYAEQFSWDRYVTTLIESLQQYS